MQKLTNYTDLKLFNFKIDFRRENIEIFYLGEFFMAVHLWSKK